MKTIKAKRILLIFISYLIISIIGIFYKQTFYKNILNPLFYIAFLIYLYFYQKNNYIYIVRNKKYLNYAFIISIIYLIINFQLGFFLGFVKNPYRIEFLSIIKNIFKEIVPIIGIEVIRNIVVQKNKNNKSVLVLITILMILSEINYLNLFYLWNTKEQLLEYCCSHLIPIIASNILFTYLTTKETYKLPLIFHLFDKFYIFLPILPNINWFLMGSLTLIKTIIIYIFFKFKLSSKKKIKENKFNVSLQINYGIALIIATFLVLFMIGAFNYLPIAILSNSMKPTYERGDVVVYKKLTSLEKENLQIGDIIIYKLDNKYIAHRIMRKIKIDEEIYYLTKGDNNNSFDNELVKMDATIGLYKFHLKYLGYPSVFLYEYFN